MGRTPKLKTGVVQAFREVMALPFWIWAVVLNGTTCLYIDSDRNLRFRDATKTTVEVDGRPVEGVIVDNEFIPADGPGSFYKLWNTTFVISFEDIHALLTPGALTVPEDELAEVVEHGVDVAVAGSGSSRLKELLLTPLWATALIVQGRTTIFIDSNYHISFKASKAVSEPRQGVVVKKEFKDDRGTGTTFTRFATKVHIALEGVEALWNPATAEILRAKEEAEANDLAIGPGQGEKRGVLCRVKTAVNAGRLREYEPFAMKDGTDTRRTMNFAFESRAKYKDRSDLLFYGGMIMAFFIGAISPRLSGAAGGGGGGGGFGVPLPTIDFTWMLTQPVVDAVVHLPGVIG